MQVRKEILLFFGLILLSASLLIASVGKDQREIQPLPAKAPPKCCQKQIKASSPWNLITEGIFHLTA